MINHGLNEYAYILEVGLGVLSELIDDSQNICGCLTVNEMYMKFKSLIICLINNNLTNTSSTPPTAGKKTLLYIAHLIILPTSTKTSIY